MPYTIRKVRNRNCYRVTKKTNSKVLSKCTSKKKAKKQIALLNAIEHNPGFVPRNRTIKRRK